MTAKRLANNQQIEFVQDKTTKAAFDPKLGIAMGIHELGMRQGFDISLYPGNGTVDGYFGDHILIAPPYNTTEQEIIEIVRRTTAVVESYFHNNHGVKYEKRPSTNGVLSNISRSEIPLVWNPSAGTPDDLARIPPI